VNQGVWARASDPQPAVHEQRRDADQDGPTHGISESLVKLTSGAESSPSIIARRTRTSVRERAGARAAH